MRPLDGVRVVDLTHAISGPTATHLLVQLGAEVAKVEPPGVGDDFRHYTEHAGLPLMSVPFAAVNAGKRSITLDLKTDGGRAVLSRLIERGDVLVENFRPGVLARLGFGPEALDRLNPRLIAASISGFGQEGPMRDWGAYDHIVQAASGIAAMNAGPDGPAKIGMPIIDSFSGYLAAIAILAALRTRDATGRGQRIDVSMLDAALKLIATGVSVWSYTGESPRGTGNRGYRMVATAEYYPTADGWIALGANHQHQIAALFRVLGLPTLIDDERFRDHAARVRHYDELRDWLLDTLSRERADDLEGRLTAAGVPAARLRDVGEIASDPHVHARGLIEEVVLPGADRPLGTVGPGFAVEPPDAPRVVPTLGAHTEEVLAELGFDADALRAEGAI